MAITANRYSQLHDYLTQVMRFSGINGVPCINQRTIAEKLSVDPSNVSRFLSKQNPTAPKMLRNFIAKYSQEYHRWPATADKINRLLTVQDALFFVEQRQQSAFVMQLPIPSQTIAPTQTVLPAVTLPTPPVQIVLPLTTLPIIPIPVPPATVGTNTVKPRVTNPQALARLRTNHAPKAPIIISYRGHTNEKDGKGMLYDHMRLQHISKSPTKVLLPDTPTAVVEEQVKQLFTNVVNAHHVNLFFGTKELPTSKPIPDYTKITSIGGLLVIPGRVRDLEYEPVRELHEYKIIRQALNRGQPILAICAGCWRLFENLSAWIEVPEERQLASIKDWNEQRGTLIPVKDHNYNGGMIRMAADGINTSYNVPIHDLVIKNKYLKKIAGEERFEVNSVHWKAINSEKKLKGFHFAAVSKKNPDNHRKSRSKEEMNPDEDTVECFVSKNGAPRIGAQWHLEAYNTNSPHGKIVNYYVAAGDTYAAKVKMLEEFKRKYQPR